MDTYGYSILIIISWLTFLIYWLVSSRTAKRNVSRSPMNARMRLVLAALVIIVALFSSYFHTETFKVTPFWGWVGAIVSMLGIAYAIYARRYLGRNWGMPMSVKENPELITTGPYAHIRHPIYTGILFTMAGSLATAGVNWVPILVIYLVYFIYSAKQEEKLMAKTFPDTYPVYKARTKMLIPFVF